MAGFRLFVWRSMAKGLWPARWIEPDLPRKDARKARTGVLTLEIVSHCWNYSHLLIYQLSSLVLFPPRDLKVIVTILYSSEDEETVRVLRGFDQIQLENVTWNWLELPRQQLFRRGIGRNAVALRTQADWVWFTDCDVLFRDNCLDQLACELQGRQDALVYPDVEYCTPILPDDHALLDAGRAATEVLDIGDMTLHARPRKRATGPLQITHGDVCRAVGYCRNIAIYQQPSETWTKAHEDGAFRWLLRTKGEALPIPSVVRIRHLSKGRYTGGAAATRLRTRIRRSQIALREPEAMDVIRRGNKPR